MNQLMMIESVHLDGRPIPTGIVAITAHKQDCQVVNLESPILRRPAGIYNFMLEFTYIFY